MNKREIRKKEIIKKKIFDFFNDVSSLRDIVHEIECTYIVFVYESQFSAISHFLNDYKKEFKNTDDEKLKDDIVEESFELICNVVPLYRCK